MKTPTRGRYERRITADQTTLLQLLIRLRAATSLQLHGFLGGRDSPRTIRHRLTSLVRRGYLYMEPVFPEHGLFSEAFYRPAFRSLRELNRKSDWSVLGQRPSQHVLQYLLLRASVFARARAEGWQIADPALWTEHSRAHLHRLFCEWALRAKKAELLSAEAGGAPENRITSITQALERLPHHLPPALTFSLLFHLKHGAMEDPVLLVIDDPRRAVAKQAVDLPPMVIPIARPIHHPRTGPRLLPGLSLLLRDTQSVYDVAARTLARSSVRLRSWHREIGERFGVDGAEHLHATDHLFPDLWVRRVNEPVASPPDARKETT
jgi:hypothetical protein